MATILDLYRDATKNKVSNDIYEKDTARIETKGIINVPRKVALAATSPNSIADLIGSQVAGALRGNANRPSDTIFKNNQPFSKPITLQNGIAIEDGKIKDIIEPGESYFVKQSPAPASVISTIEQGASNPLAIATNIAANALRNPIATSKAVKDLTKNLTSANDKKNYGAAKTIDRNGNYQDTAVRFSQYVPTYIQNGNIIVTGSLKARDTSSVSTWDTVNNLVLNGTANSTSSFNIINSTRVEIQTYGKSDKIILPGTVSSIQESFTPEWNNFKYVGSPFFTYRYSGVERSLNFDLKMYYLDDNSKQVMKRNLDKLRTLVYPFEELATITYSSGSKAVAFSPNLVYISITGLYENLFGFISELNFSIDDSVSWATTDLDMSGIKTAPYPTVFNVSMGFKIIPDAEIQTSGKTQTLKYNFTSGSIK